MNYVCLFILILFIDHVQSSSFTKLFFYIFMYTHAHISVCMYVLMCARFHVGVAYRLARIVNFFDTQVL